MRSPLFKRAALVASVAGLAVIAHFEGTRTTAYLDGGGVATICTGHTKHVRVGDQATLGQCEVWLREDTSVAGVGVSRRVTADITQDQYDALLSFTFNLGETALARSTLLRKVNAGDCLGAVAEFPRWNRIKGKVSRGLTIRRAAEAELFKKGCDVR